jgi:hypothetical protein
MTKIFWAETTRPYNKKSKIESKNFLGCLQVDDPEGKQVFLWLSGSNFTFSAPRVPGWKLSGLKSMYFIQKKL